jgi:hypothetical protein
MKKIILFTVCLIFIVLNSACVPYWDRPVSAYIIPSRADIEAPQGNPISLGMTKVDVLAIAGSPTKRIKIRKNEEIWVYDRMRKEGKKYTLYFFDNKLEKIKAFCIDSLL